MAAKAVLFVCAQALLLQLISAQYRGAPWAAGAWEAAPLAAPWAPCGAELLASHGSALPIASASPIPPSGVAVASENAYAGELAVRGALPFLGTVGLEGALPTAGSAAVKYGCGNGEVAMLTEDIGAAGPLAYGPGIGAFEAPLAAPAFARTGCGRAALL